MAKSIIIIIALCVSSLGVHVAGNGDVTPKEKTKQECIIYTYRAEIGVVEVGGNNSGPEVSRYLKYTGLSEGYAWCAAFVCWSLGQCGIENPKTAWSPSLLPRNKTVYDRAIDEYFPSWRPGLVGSLYYNSLKRIGHVFFIDKDAGEYVYTVEGNTNELGGREGDGVLRKIRNKKTIYKVALYE